MFRLARTYDDPASGSNSQRGYPSPGEGEQATGQPATQDTSRVPNGPIKLFKGLRTWLSTVTGSNPSRGMPEAEDALQHRPPGSVVDQQMFGGVVYNETPYYDRGAAAFVPNFGTLVSNPIGAGRQVPWRPQAFYDGQSGEYENGSIWWVSQSTPTSTNLTGLQDANALLDEVGSVNVEAMVRVG